MLHNMRYRLALDLGTTSIGWAILRLNDGNEPYAIPKAGVRIFSDGRNPKDGSSLAVTRREARSARKRRDRLLQRKGKMMQALIDLGFFPKDKTARQRLTLLNPHELRAKGLDEALKPEEFARALFHINQRRGFKSNRKTDKKNNDSGALKTAVKKLHETLENANVKTVGEWLYQRHQAGETVRARFRQSKITTEEGKTKTLKSYDLYIDRAMIEAEFDALWAAQASFNPQLFNEQAREKLKDILLFQRKLQKGKVGRCTLLPDEERAPLALPSQQRFRIYQEVNNLRLLQADLNDKPLNKEQRDIVVNALDKSRQQSFKQIKKLLGLHGDDAFTLEDGKRKELKGNLTAAILAKPTHFGKAWFDFSDAQQDTIVLKLLTEENESALTQWLMSQADIDEATAETIANINLPDGYGNLSDKALEKILPALKADVITYDKAVIAAGFDHHSNISHAGSTGEVLESLPYYGKLLTRHVGFGSGVIDDPDEKRYGKIANPTVHIGLNQIRKVVNALINKYGHPSEVIVEVARDLKQSQAQKQEAQRQQTRNQERNKRLRTQIAGILEINEANVKRSDLQKMILWEELSFDPAFRQCPYSGQQLSAEMVLSDAVEIEHILPFSKTLDDSLMNKTVSLRAANRIKGNRTPWEAKDDFAAQGWDVEAMLERAQRMPRGKRYRFGEDGYQKWLKEEDGFLARALNDTRYLSRIAKEYVSLICPKTRVIPGQMTAMLRRRFGLDEVLGLKGIKNRNDHRHHAVDACVIGVTDHAMLQRFANASASAREKQLDKLVETMPLPWDNYRDHVVRAISNIKVSHKPDHSHEGQMHNDTAYGLLADGLVQHHKWDEGVKEKVTSKLNVIPFADNHPRHGVLDNGEPKPYKGYKGDSNYCVEVVVGSKGKWTDEIISTYDAYQVARRDGLARLSNKTLSLSNKPLVMRLMKNDILSLTINSERQVMRVVKFTKGKISMTAINEANADARYREGDTELIVNKSAGSLQKANAKAVTISPIGELSVKRVKLC